MIEIGRNITSGNISKTYEIDFEPIAKRVEVVPGTTLLDAARQAGVLLSSECGGKGKCGQCRVKVVEGEVTPLSENEKTILGEEAAGNGERLACSAQINSNVKVTIPETSLVTEQRLQLKGDTSEIGVDSLVRAYQVKVQPPSLDDLRTDLERVSSTLLDKLQSKGILHAEPEVIRQVSCAAREYGWELTAYLRGDEIIGIAPRETPSLGMAVDLGTTKIAASLADMRTGKELSVTGALNPQIGYGEDVISRLAYAFRNKDGTMILASEVRRSINDLLGKLVAEAGVDRMQVTDVCIVGNTAMTHLLLELPVRQLATSPYVAATNAAMDVKARMLGLSCAPGAYAHILPCIGGFVGADHVAMILANHLDQAEHTAIGIDIGTNTEIVLINPGEKTMTSVSCASGPAFEGAHIGDGMRAASGAIEAVFLSGSGCTLKTIGGAAPIGLCGSGIVDAVAELYRWRLINGSGRFDVTNERIRYGRRGPEFLLASKKQSGSGRDVVITQQDINEVQLAKGAIRAGMEILMEATNTDPTEVKEVIIAGAFGSFLNVENALVIGLMPRLPNARYRQVGNAALVGARMALLSREERIRAQQIAANCGYIDLTTYPRFNRHFAQGMLFPERPQPHQFMQ